MFRYAAFLAPLLPLCCSFAAEPVASMPATHQEFIPALLELLEQTEQCLSSCSDAATVQAALPRFHELAEQARRLSAHQRSLPDPTVQDLLAAHPHVAEFNRLWEAICGHIERLEAARLISPELREALKLAPAEK